MPEGLVIVWQLGASSLFPWRVYKGVYRCPRGALWLCGSQVPALVFLWRVRKGICGCQRGGLFVTVRKASNRFVTVRKSKWQSGASSLFSIVWQSVASYIPLAGLWGVRRCLGGLFTIVRQSGASSYSFDRLN
jgi:hypothetical protein